MGRSLDFEAFSRFVDKVKSPGLGAALGAAHVDCHRAWQLSGGLPDCRQPDRYARSVLPGPFLHSLVPIALGYVTAHYLKLLILEGQRVFITSSDPLSLGWDLFGTAGWGINASIVNYPGLIGSIQAAAIVVGHTLGVILAHDRALALFRAGPR